MIDHISVAVRDLDASVRFYQAVLGAIGYQKLVVRPRTVGFGKSYPEFWVNLRAGLLPISRFETELGEREVRAFVIRIQPQRGLQSLLGIDQMHPHRQEARFEPADGVLDLHPQLLALPRVIERPGGEVRDGQEVDRIVGALPRAAMEQRLRPVLLPER